MNLEAIEQRVLAYLEQVSNPLVRMSTLLVYVRESEEFAEVSEKELFEFLRDHELFKIIEPASYSEGLDTALETVGLLNERAVMLETRMPTPSQVSELMESQLAALGEALSTAFRDAREKGDELRQERIKRLLQRTDALRKKMRS